MRFSHMLSLIIIFQSLVTAALETRLELPTDDAQKQSSTLIHDVFKNEYAKTAPADKVALAKKLLQQGTETRDDPSAKFVLFRETIDLAAQAGDAVTLVQAVDAQADAFKIDLAGALEKALDRVSGKVAAQDQRRAVVNGYLRVVDLSCETNDYELASRSAGKAEAAARPAQDMPLLTRVQAKNKDVKGLAAEYQKVGAALEKLKNTPDDAEACTAVGRFYCIVKGNWDAGLTLLAKGSDQSLKTLAEKEVLLQNSLPDSPALAELGDGWWVVAEKQTGEAKQTVKEHAVFIYSKAVDGLTGLNKTRIQKKIEELSSTAAPTNLARRELLPLVDVAAAVKGTWKREGADIVSDRTQYGRLMLPCVLGNEYDVKFEFTCTVAKDVATLILQRDGKPFAFEFGSYGKLAGFTLIDGRGLDANPTATEIPGGYQLGKRYIVTVQVRKEKLTALLDGKLLVETAITNDHILLDSRWALPVKDRLGIGGYGGILRFHSIQVSGQATLAK